MPGSFLWRLRQASSTPSLSARAGDAPQGAGWSDLRGSPGTAARHALEASEVTRVGLESRRVQRGASDFRDRFSHRSSFAGHPAARLSRGAPVEACTGSFIRTGLGSGLERRRAAARRADATLERRPCRGPRPRRKPAESHRGGSRAWRRALCAAVPGPSVPLASQVVPGAEPERLFPGPDPRRRAHPDQVDSIVLASEGSPEHHEGFADVLGWADDGPWNRAARDWEWPIAEPPPAASWRSYRAAGSAGRR